MLEKNGENRTETPPTNRGVGRTLNPTFSYMGQGFCAEKKQFVLFDWFQATILSENFDFDNTTGELVGVRDFKDRARELFYELFKINSNDLVFEYKGINGYNASFSYKEIYIMYNTSRPDMGVHIKMSGRGCRDFENLGLDYYELFRKLSTYTVNFNRIDIAIDDFTDDYFTLKKLIRYVRKGLVSSKFLTCLNFEKICLEDSSCLGHTLQFGSKASNVQVTFYDKKLERQSQNILVDKDVEFWTRCELRFRHEYCKQVIELLLNGSDVNIFVKSILKEYISFKTKHSNDSNIRRRPEADWWSAYLGNVDKLRLKNYLPEDSITRKSNWLMNSTAKTQLMVYLADLDNIMLDDLSSEYLINIFQKGFSKFDLKDLQTINFHRLSKKLDPLSESEIYAYIQDLQEKVLLEDMKKENYYG